MEERWWVEREEMSRQEREHAAAQRQRLEGLEQTLLLGRREVINGLVIEPGINGRTVRSVSFDDDKGRLSSTKRRHRRAQPIRLPSSLLGCARRNVGHFDDDRLLDDEALQSLSHGV